MHLHRSSRKVSPLSRHSFKVVVHLLVINSPDPAHAHYTAREVPPAHRGCDLWCTTAAFDQRQAPPPAAVALTEHPDLSAHASFDGTSLLACCQCRGCDKVRRLSLHEVPPTAPPRGPQCTCLSSPPARGRSCRGTCRTAATHPSDRGDARQRNVKCTGHCGPKPRACAHARRPVERHYSVRTDCSLLDGQWV